MNIVFTSLDKKVPEKIESPSFEKKNHPQKEISDIAKSSLCNKNFHSLKENEDYHQILQKLQLNYSISNEIIQKMVCESFFKELEPSQFFNTLIEIVENNEMKSFYCPRKENTYGWSVDNGEIFIRKKLLTEGEFSKASTVLSLKNLKEYVNLSPKKGIRDNETNKIKTYYSQKQFQHINKLKIEEASNNKYLHFLKIPHIIPSPIATFVSTTKKVGEKASFIVEKCEQDLFDKLDTYYKAFLDGEPLQGFPLDDFKHTIEICFECIKSLHEKNLSHNDLKPENFLLGQNGEIYLSDLDGLTKADGSQLLKISSKDYWPPEIWRQYSKSMPIFGSSKNDAYALGIMYLEFLFGSRFLQAIFLDRQPFVSKKWDRTFYLQDLEKIKLCNPSERNHLMQKLNEDYKNGTFPQFMGTRFYDENKLFELVYTDLNKELTLRQLLSEQQKQIALNIIMGLLHPIAESRMTVEDAYKLHMKFVANSKMDS